jgi:Uma2 family endonuclease
MTRFGANDGRVELIDGTYVLRPWPTPLQSRVTRRLARLLTGAAASGTKVFPRRTAIEIGRRCLLVPDIVVASPGPDGIRLTDLPFLVIEVADASKRRFDRLKLDIYRERGVPACWLVDPDIPAIEAYELIDGGYVLTVTARGDRPLVAVRPFPVTIIPDGLVDPPDPD